MVQSVMPLACKATPRASLNDGYQRWLLCQLAKVCRAMPARNGGVVVFGAGGFAGSVFLTLPLVALVIRGCRWDWMRGMDPTTLDALQLSVLTQ